MTCMQVATVCEKERWQEREREKEEDRKRKNGILGIVGMHRECYQWRLRILPVFVKRGAKWSVSNVIKEKQWVENCLCWLKRGNCCQQEKHCLKCWRFILLRAGYASVVGSASHPKRREALRNAGEVWVLEAPCAMPAWWSNSRSSMARHCCGFRNHARKSCLVLFPKWYCLRVQFFILFSIMLKDNH